MREKKNKNKNRRSGSGRKKKSGTGILILLLMLVVAAGAAVGVAFGRGLAPGGSEALTALVNKLDLVIFRHGTEEETETLTSSDGDVLILPASSSAKEQFEIYVGLLNKKEYGMMYSMISDSCKATMTEEAFISRNQGIYEGISASDITVTWPENGQDTSEDGLTVSYTITMNTVAGELTYDNTTTFVSEDGVYHLEWDDTDIFPDLESTDKVRVISTIGQRGCIYDRNGNPLATNISAVSIGLVPNEMESDSAQKVADLLGVSVSSIEEKLSASWVKESSFVPIETIEGISEDGTLSQETEAETEAKKKSSGKDEEEDGDDSELDPQDKQTLLKTLKTIPGVMLKDTTVRSYPLGEAAAHIVGYIQNITTDELAADTAGVYTSGSQVGKSGVEKAYEDQLRGATGRKMVIVAENGDTKKVLLTSDSGGGQDVTLSIDADLQQLVYDTYSEVNSATVAMNPYTGEILAMVSTPSYDTNLFGGGISTEQWNTWTDDENKPLLSRFLEAWTPGSSMKTVTGLIGVTTGLLDPKENLKSSKSWSGGESWGEYKVTTLHVAKPANLTNALIISDNVYFAKAAVQIGADEMENGWNSCGFNESVPLPLTVTASTYSTSDHLEDEAQLANSGYGQGQMQVNPIHLAAIYSAMLNEGSMVTPTLEVTTHPTYWKQNVFSAEACETVETALEKVVSNSSGTGHSAYMKGLKLAGKTGTAELKSTKDEKDGGELGWFTSFTTEKDEDESLLICTMVENAQNLGGSSYVVKKSRTIYTQWYQILKNRDRAVEELEQEAEEASRESSVEASKAAKTASKEASKAAKESSKEASKAAKEASKEVSKAAKESSEEASKAAAEVSKAAAESSKEAERSLEDN